ncbi:MAG: hypothetical protein OXN80_02360 [bacterium]|nr:hypothetical protein [bacterium]
MKRWVIHYASVLLGLIGALPLTDWTVPDDWHWFWEAALVIAITLIVILFIEQILSWVFWRKPRKR